MNNSIDSQKLKDNEFYRQAIIEAVKNHDIHDVEHYLECLSPSNTIYFNFNSKEFFRVLEIEEDINGMVYVTTSERGLSHCLKSDLHFC